MLKKIKMVAFLLAGCCKIAYAQNAESQYRTVAIDGTIHTLAAGRWDVNLKGNHRAVVFVNNAVDKAVKVIIPWRRADPLPEQKKIIVVDAATGKEVQNVFVKSINNETGELAFEPATTNANYEIYYLPYKFRPVSDDARYGKPWNDYLAPDYNPGSNWLNYVKQNYSLLPVAKLLKFEARTKFDLFTSMGLIATQVEDQQIIRSCKNDFLVFPEDRAFPIRLINRLPVRWIQNHHFGTFEGTAQQNEYYTLQLGVFACKNKLSDVKVTFSNLVNKASHTFISRDSLTCFNQEGTNWDGKPIKFRVAVTKGGVQALWIGVSVPENAVGNYEGWITINAANKKPEKVKILIHVAKNRLADRGDADLWRHSRLRWLNSTLGISNGLIAPYKALQRQGRTITSGGKQVMLDAYGLPGQISNSGVKLFAAPLAVKTEAGGESLKLTPTAIHYHDTDGKISWFTNWLAGGCIITCNAAMEFDGTITYWFALNSNSNKRLSDISLKLSFNNKSVPYFMGIGVAGGNMPQLPYSWNWKGPWDSFWLGNADAGVHLEFQKSAYNGPLLNDYKPAPPPVWANGDKGAVNIKHDRSANIVVTANTGEHILQAGKKLEFGFKLLITPVKPIDTRKHFSERYYQGNPLTVEKAAAEGANVINVHHNTSLNPFINYPFIVRDSLQAYIQNQHSRDRRVKLYYTIRELSDHAVELYALKSLNGEIFPTGPGMGPPWLWEHLNTGYKAAWYSPFKDQTADASIVMNGFSRWINYYIEGLRWMLVHDKIDGLYLDDVAYDRDVIERLRRVLLNYNPNALLDLHSNTNYSVGPANQYTSFFPYLDRIWFGESFKYDQMTPDEWFVQFSGIPFGQMSEMLEGGGNKWLGMVYGTTVRHSWGSQSPAAIWKYWDAFNIKDATMYGYWNKDCPVTSDNDKVKITVYAQKHKLLLALGNFSDTSQYVTPRFKPALLNLHNGPVTIRAPNIEEYQPQAVYEAGKPIKVDPKKGLLLEISTY
jgi:hypothetical protein